jgi:hypothetical protein
MSQQLSIQKNSLEKLLKPVNRITESCVIRSGEKCVYTVCSSSDNSVILYAKTQIEQQLESIRVNVINIKKLLTGLDCLGDGGEFNFLYDKNSITCKSTDITSCENTQFKYHLVDDHIIKESTFDVQMIASLNFDTLFEIPVSKIKQIMSAYSYVDGVNKIYFYTKEGKVYAEINDKTMQNIDNVSMVLSNSFVGDEIIIPLAIKIEIFKSLSLNKSSLKVKINNEFKVFVFHTQEDENTELKYIVSALVK